LLLRLAVAVLVLASGAASARAAPDVRAAECLPEQAACVPPIAGQPAVPAAGAAPDLVVYWGVGCPHCEEARPAVGALAARIPGLVVEWVEVRQSADGLARLRADAARLGVAAPGIPMFVARGREAIVGYRSGITEDALEQALGIDGPGRGAARRGVRVPWLGELDPARIPFAAFTMAVGLVDGVNPCAMYVLVVLLGLLLHAGSRGRVALYGAIFVAASGIVYFAFMSAWLGLFQTAGLARWVTIVLGVILVGMGIVNLKELVWFRRGPSLMIPESAKPGIFRRMRRIAGAPSLPVAAAGIAGLALLVNLVELGCTLGLPAVYTRVLSLREATGPVARLGWLALYNLAYVIPLGVIVLVAVASMRKITLGERPSRFLKGISGTLLVAFGLIFLLAPDLLR
jgi:hypothetical protein